MDVATVPILSEAQARALIGPADALRAIEDAFAEYGRERRMLSDPPALVVRAGRPGDITFKVKGSRLPGRGLTGFRLISDRDAVVGGDVAVDYHWVAAADTGELRGLVEETTLYRLRTAATGVVAARWLARPGSRVAAILGAGHIAAEMPPLLKAALDLDDVRVAASRPGSAAAFAARHGATLPLRACDTVDEAIDGADLVFGITSSREPVIARRHLRPGMTVCGLGGGGEIAADALERVDRLVVDDLAFALTIGSMRGWHQAGMSVAELERRLSADIGEIATGAKPGRTSPSETVVAVIQGMACCDLALAAVALDRLAAERDGA